MKYLPANNVIFAFIGGCVSYALLMGANHFGYSPPSDIADGLPMAVSMAIAHSWDMWTGDNKPK